MAANRFPLQTVQLFAAFAVLSAIGLSFIIPLVLHGHASDSISSSSTPAQPASGNDPLPEEEPEVCSEIGTKRYSTRLSGEEDIKKRRSIDRKKHRDETEDDVNRERDLMENFYLPVNDDYLYPGSERYERRTSKSRRRLPKYEVLSQTRFRVVPSVKVNTKPFPLTMRRKLRERTPHAILQVHYMEEHMNSKRSCTPSGALGEKCFTELSTGAVWKSRFDYVLNTTNDYGIGATTMKQWTAASFNEWDNKIPAFDIVGGLSSESFDGVDGSAPDGKSEVTFGPLDDLSVLAVAIVWGFFDGPTSQREIIECDVVLNSNVAEDWGDAGSLSNVHDVQNILTHEIGHCIGGADRYDDDSSELTLYGFASLGETKKRSTEACETTGAQACYAKYT